MASFVCTNSRHQKDVVSDVTPQESLPEPESARPPGQHNPFDLWITACPAPKVPVDVVCHLTRQFVQYSHKGPRLPRDQQELLKRLLCPLSAVCLLQQQGKHNLPHFKATCTIWNKPAGGVHSAESTLSHRIKELQTLACLRRVD